MQRRFRRASGELPILQESSRSMTRLPQQLLVGIDAQFQDLLVHLTKVNNKGHLHRRRIRETQSHSAIIRSFLSYTDETSNMTCGSLRHYSNTAPFILLWLLSLTPLAISQPITCPDGSTGYGDVVGLNRDIDVEVQRIQQGGTAKLLYLYRLCPNVEIIMTEPLRPKLDGSIFRCGDSGLPAEDCQFTGGDHQVIVSPSEISSFFPMQEVRFEGVTFTSFSESAISGDATDETTVTLEEVQFVVRHGDRRSSTKTIPIGSLHPLSLS
jgi:hypothetical protein